MWIETCGVARVLAWMSLTRLSFLFSLSFLLDQVKQEMSKMVRFIQQEAREKANEIMAKAQEEFSIEKGTLVQQEKTKIITAYERKMKQVEVQRKIQYSNRLNQSRLKILQARDQVVESIFQEARSRLTQIVSSPNYKSLLSKLVLQALFLCMEAKVTIVARKQDVAAVQAVIPEAVNLYKQALGKSTEVTVSTTEFLPDEM